MAAAAHVLALLTLRRCARRRGPLSAHGFQEHKGYHAGIAAAVPRTPGSPSRDGLLVLCNGAGGVAHAVFLFIS
jgi:hypothetical protein